MSSSDLIRTSGQKDMLNRHLAQTEQTNAVNSGLVGRADKSEEALMGDLYDSLGQRAAQRASADASVLPGRLPQGRRESAPQGSTNAAGAGTTNGRDQAGSVWSGESGQTGTSRLPARATRRSRASRAEAKAVEQENTRVQSERHLKEYLKKGTAGAATRETLEDTEFEGADELYYETRGAAKSASRLMRGIRRRISGSDALSEEKSLGKLSEKAYRTKPVNAADVQRKAQVMQLMRRGIFAAQEARIEKEAEGVARTAKVIGAGGAGGGRGLFALFASSIVPPIIGILLALLLLISIISAVVGSDNRANNRVVGFGDLTGIELEVAQALADAGLGRAQIAAIMGNIVGESGFNPNCEYHGEGNNYAYEYGYGLYQFTDTSGGGDEYSRFIGWCNANGKSRSSAAAQTQFFIEHLRGSWGTALHNSGYYTKYLTAFAGRDASYDAWLATDDVDFATYCVMACWLRPADWAANQSFYRDRLPAAQAYYAKLSEGGGRGQDYAASDATQRSIVDAAYRTPSPGLGWCALWVSNVYANAGLGGIGGNACDMYAAYCHSTDRSQLKVGMLVAVRSSSSGSAAGATYGHVGIYIGNNQVIHNMGSIAVWSLDDWINTYCKWSPAGWGFPSNVQ